MKKEEIRMNFRVDPELYEKMRKLSFDTRLPLAELARQGLILILKKHEKKNNKNS